MSAKQAAMLSFLRDNGAPEDMVEILKDETAAIYDIARSGKYPILPAEEQDAEAIAAAVRLATGFEVTRVEFVSLSNPFSGPGQTSQQVHETVYHLSLGHSIWYGLGIADFWHRHSVQTGLRDRFRGSLGDSLWSSLGDSNWDSLEAYIQGNSFGFGYMVCSTRNSLQASLRDNIRDSLTAGLSYYHAAALVGDRERFDRLTPLIRKCRKSAPSLGFKIDEPTVLQHPSD